MNESGMAVAAIARYYKIEPEAILVIHDDLDLPPGQIRLKIGGGLGGHNGLRSIEQHLGSRQFNRLRIGIGHPGHRDQVTPFVLKAPNLQEKKQINQSITDSLACLDTLLAGHLPQVMQILHTDPNIGCES